MIALLLGGAVLAAIARRPSMPYPALVAIAGAALALFPRVPSLVLDPELALALFVAPVLLDSTHRSAICAGTGGPSPAWRSARSCSPSRSSLSPPMPSFQGAQRELDIRKLDLS